MAIVVAAPVRAEHCPARLNTVKMRTIIPLIAVHLPPLAMHLPPAAITSPAVTVQRQDHAGTQINISVSAWFRRVHTFRDCISVHPLCFTFISSTRNTGKSRRGTDATPCPVAGGASLRVIQSGLEWQGSELLLRRHPVIRHPHSVWFSIAKTRLTSRTTGRIVFVTTLSSVAVVLAAILHRWPLARFKQWTTWLFAASVLCTCPRRALSNGPWS